MIDELTKRRLERRLANIERAIVAGQNLLARAKELGFPDDHEDVREARESLGELEAGYAEAEADFRRLSS